MFVVLNSIDQLHKIWRIPAKFAHNVKKFFKGIEMCHLK